MALGRTVPPWGILKQTDIVEDLNRHDDDDGGSVLIYKKARKIFGTIGLLGNNKHNL